jgi:glucosamine--fructose-6-phosphate aminotransferase (isomerizing)
MSTRSEIFEQPQVLANLLDSQMQNVGQIAAALRSQAIQYAFLAARGTSDNAGRYANYLWGAFNRLPIALATPSLFTLYDQPPRLDGALVLGVSQSGQSPDIVRVLEEGRRQGRPTLAITNAADSPLAQAADFVIDVRAGDEKAVAATKTYSAELMAIAMLSAAMHGDAQLIEQLRKVPDWVRLSLQLEDQLARMAERYRYMQRCVVIGRGYNYATAFEWSLKLKELTYVVAEPYSSADFLHGPIAMVDQGFPVMAVAPQGHVYADLLALLERLRHEQAAELVVISDGEQALSLAQSPVMLPAGIPEWLTPLVAIVPAQLFSYYLAVVKGYDTETPRSIQKVTLTR